MEKPFPLKCSHPAAESQSPKKEISRQFPLRARVRFCQTGFMPSSNCQPAAISRLEGVVVSVDTGDQLARTLLHNAPIYDRLAVVTTPSDRESQAAARRHPNVELVISEACYADGDAFNKGRMINAGLEALELDDWLLFTDADCFLPAYLRSRLARVRPDPDCLHYVRRWHLEADATEADTTRIIRKHAQDRAGNAMPWGYFQLCRAETAAKLCGGALEMPSCFCSAACIDHWLMSRWRPERRKKLPSDLYVLHLWHGPLGSRWNGRSTQGWRFAGQSTTAPESRLRPSWPAPCLVRRTHVLTCQQHVVRYDGQDPDWPTPTIAGEPYEYATMSCEL